MMRAWILVQLLTLAACSAWSTERRDVGLRCTRYWDIEHVYMRCHRKLAYATNMRRRLTTGHINQAFLRSLLTFGCSTAWPRLLECFEENVSNCENRDELNAMAATSMAVCRGNEVAPWVETIVLSDYHSMEGKCRTQTPPESNYCLSNTWYSIPIGASVQEGVDIQNGNYRRGIRCRWENAKAFTTCADPKVKDVYFNSILKTLAYGTYAMNLSNDDLKYLCGIRGIDEQNCPTV